MSRRTIQPERGAQYSVHDDGSITYFDEPTPELRAEAEQAARALRSDPAAVTVEEEGDDGDDWSADNDDSDEEGDDARS